MHGNLQYLVVPTLLQTLIMASTHITINIVAFFEILNRLKSIYSKFIAPVYQVFFTWFTRISTNQNAITFFFYIFLRHLQINLNQLKRVYAFFTQIYSIPANRELFSQSRTIFIIFNERPL